MAVPAGLREEAGPGNGLGMAAHSAGLHTQEAAAGRLLLSEAAQHSGPCLGLHLGFNLWRQELLFFLPWSL